ncbi:NRDE family protein [Algoriphagus litoralis]|uniref:NRDE family protein n=1 Tax=Algoriphagus litoralis TaxID=2202829 RepID=UPI000DBA4230|nr:NRDE family protein [Algoriphagus litoralis]
MCLVAFSWKNHPDYPLIISANRDEFFDRPTESLHQWDSGIIAGRDLRAGGTWMGFHPDGKWALLTNYRDFSRSQKGDISRGKLVQEFLEGYKSPEAYLEGIFKDKDRYDGFNLLVSDGEKLFYLSNYAKKIEAVSPGIHGLSNGLINDPWPKVELAKKQLANLLAEGVSDEKLLGILKSKETYPLDTLPKTGAPEQLEIGLSAQLIRITPNYGTVSSAAVLKNSHGLTTITERTFTWNPSSYKDLQLHI